MHIGVMTLHLSIEGAQSLKEKRHAVRSLIERTRNRFNVSASEVDDLNAWQRATIGVAMVSNEAAFVHKVLEKVVDFVESDGRVVLDGYNIEML